MSSLGKIFDQLNFFAAASVIGTTALTVIFFEKYAKKKLPAADGFEKQAAVEEIHDGWYAGLFVAELYGQFTAAKTLDATDAVLNTILNFLFNVFVFSFVTELWAWRESTKKIFTRVAKKLSWDL